MKIPSLNGCFLWGNLSEPYLDRKSLRNSSSLWCFIDIYLIIFSAISTPLLRAVVVVVVVVVVVEEISNNVEES